MNAVDIEQAISDLALQPFDGAEFAFSFLADIATIQESSDNPIDVRAIGRLNKLYVELLRKNPDWATAERRSNNA